MFFQSPIIIVAESEEYFLGLLILSQIKHFIEVYQHFGKNEAIRRLENLQVSQHPTCCSETISAF